MKELHSLTLDDVERIEKQSLRTLYIAAREFGSDAFEIFRQSHDDPKDVAEDVTREMLDRLGGYGIPQRIFGNMDYRKARLVILPEFAIRQALFVDSKAEKTCNSVTLQLSQLSIRVRQFRHDEAIDIPGRIKPIEEFDQIHYLSTILLAHYHYDSAHSGSGKDIPPYKLLKLTLSAIPSGLLQDKYNPDASDSIWLVGRNAPSRGEEFRVRLSFRALRAKERWRVQELRYDQGSGHVTGDWLDE